MADLLSRPLAPPPEGFDDAARRFLHVRHLAAYAWALPFLEGRRVLEIGTHQGYGSRLIAPRARRWVGIDLSFDHARAARAETGAPVIQADGQKIPLADGSVDAVVTFQVIEHVWKDRAYLREIHRVLCDGGLLIVSSPQRRGRLFVGQIPWNEEHLREYDERSWRARLEEVFGSVEVSGLFGSSLADAVERARVRSDPWGYYFGGPWGRPARAIGRVLAGIRGRDREVTPADVGSVRSSDDALLMRHFSVRAGDLEEAMDLFAVCEKRPDDARETAVFGEAAYWRERLRERPGLDGTGTSLAPVAWQNWLYRGKTRAYLRLLRRCGVDLRGKSVLDFGCGTGYFETVWERKGARRADGIDIVPEAIERLRRAHPERRYVCADLSTETGATDLSEIGEVEIITAIDVLYHIVDDERLLRTLGRLCSRLAPGGWFLFTDALRETESAPHVRFRSLNHWCQILAGLGLVYAQREPVLALNNRPGKMASRFPGLTGLVQHTLDLPVLRTMPWTANNWAVLARRPDGSSSTPARGAGR